MCGLRLAFIVLTLGVLPGCSLFWGSVEPDSKPDYFAVSHAVEPLWQGREADSIAHLRLRLWVKDARAGGSLSNTYDPHAKVVGSWGILFHRRKGRDDAFVFEDARRVTPASGEHYGIVYDDLAMLWSEKDGFEPVALPDIKIPMWFSGGVGGGVAVIPGRAIVVRTEGGLAAMDWAGDRLHELDELDGADIESVFPVLGDSAILIAHGEGPNAREGASLWRPGEGLHRIVRYKEGSVHGPANAYFGFDAERDRIFHLSWPSGGKPKASRVLNVCGWRRTASSMSPDGRFVVSGGFGFKVIRANPLFHEVHENGTTIKRQVAKQRAYQALAPVWLHRDFGAPDSVERVRRPY